jgi:hypothetical protein
LKSDSPARGPVDLRDAWQSAISPRAILHDALDLGKPRLHRIANPELNTQRLAVFRGLFILSTVMLRLCENRMLRTSENSAGVVWATTSLRLAIHVAREHESPSSLVG